jgi:hypothetical protein
MMKIRSLSLRIFKVSVVLQLFLMTVAGGADAHPVEGSWIYVSSGDLLSKQVTKKSEKEWLMQALKKKIMTSSSCMLDIQSSSTVTLDLLYKDDAKDQRRYLRIKDAVIKASGVAPGKTLSRYTLEPHDCSGNIGTLLVQDNKMVALDSGFRFYTYIRATRRVNNDPLAHSSNERVSSFPFSPGNFSALCEPFIHRIKGVPQGTTACSPLFFPYIAKKDTKKVLTDIVGHHHYIKGDVNYSNDYDDPFSNGLHPVYMVLPPLNDVSLIRVEDLEGNADERDMYSGSYLSIRNDSVVDQLQDGCIMMAGYICLNGDAEKIARMLPSGKFERFK